MGRELSIHTESIHSEVWLIISVRSILIMNLSWNPRNFKGNPLPKDTKKVTIQAGIHRIKIDLINIPIREKPKPKPSSGGCPN